MIPYIDYAQKFKSLCLTPLLTHRAVLITVSRLEDGDLLQVNVCPRRLKEGENPALTSPLCIIGTAAELDAELAPQIAGFIESHVGLNTNLASIEKEIGEADKAAREEAKKKHKVVGNGGKRTADATTTTLPSPPAKPEPQPAQTLSLFDQQPSTTATIATDVTQLMNKDCEWRQERVCCQISLNMH